MTGETNLKALVEHLALLRARKKEIDRRYKAVMDPLKAETEQVEAEIRKTMGELGMKSMSADVGSVALVKRDYPVVKDWAGVYKFIKDTGRIDLLQRRLAAGTTKDIIEEGTEVPGVEMASEITVRFTPRKEAANE